MTPELQWLETKLKALEATREKRNAYRKANNLRMQPMSYKWRDEYAKIYAQIKTLKGEL